MAKQFQLQTFKINNTTIVAVVLLFASLATLLLVNSFAGSESVSIEAEDASGLVDSKIGNDQNASGGKYLELGEEDETIPEGWSILFEDKFNGSVLDTSRWQAYHNTYGDGNNELACLTPDNVTLSNGSLFHTAKRENVSCPGKPVDEFTSGFIGSRETGTYYPLYGRYEIKVKIPHAQGLWPGFWLRHRNGSSTAEVDIMEYFHSQVPGKITQTLHLPKNIGYNVTKKTTFVETPTNSPAWHTYAVEIEPAGNDVRFKFFVDGTQVNSYTDTNPTWADDAAANASWDMAINLSVGGKWVGHPDDPLGQLSDLGKCAQSGTYPNCSSNGIVRANFPEVYEVDWVRVYQR